MAQWKRILWPMQDIGDTGSISGSGRSPGVGDDNSLQYSCLGNPMDRGAWWATVHGVAKCLTLLSMCLCVCVHARTCTHTHKEKSTEWFHSSIYSYRPLCIDYLTISHECGILALITLRISSNLLFASIHR